MAKLVLISMRLLSMEKRSPESLWFSQIKVPKD